MVSETQRAEFVVGMLDHLVQCGLTYPEVVKFAAFTADSLERMRAAGQEPLECLRSKTAEGLLSAVLPEVWSGAKNIFGKGVDIATGTVEKGVDTGIKWAPWVLGAGLVAPYVGGYAAGHGMGTLTDSGDEMVKAIQQRELVSLLRENARLASQSRLVEDARNQQIASKRQRRIA